MADNEKLDNTLARLSAAATETENILEELAMIFAELATQDYCPAIYRDRKYLGRWMSRTWWTKRSGTRVPARRTLHLRTRSDLNDRRRYVRRLDAHRRSRCAVRLRRSENFKLPPSDGSDDASPAP